MKYGLGYAYMPLANDKEIVQETQRWSDPLLRSEQYTHSSARENIKAPWYNEWDRYTQQQVQEALLKRIDPRKALENSATRARDLKRQWK